MKNLKNACVLALLFSSTAIFAQVQIDKPIQLTGGAGQRSITNLEAPVNGTDAVNKDYVDAAVAASGGSMPTMISNESPSQMNFVNALYYCRDLNESTYTDWYLPGQEQLEHILGKDGVSISSPTSTSYFWLKHDGNALSNGTYLPIFSIGSSNYSQSAGTSTSYYVRCVR